MPSPKQPKPLLDAFRYIAIQCNGCGRLGEDQTASSAAQLRGLLQERGWLIHIGPNIDYCEACAKEHKLQL